MNDEKILDAPISQPRKTTSSLASYQNSALRTEAVLGAFWLGGWVCPYVIAGQWVWGMPVYVFFGIGLGFVYLLIPTLLFKSRGWKRHFLLISLACN